MAQHVRPARLKPDSEALMGEDEAEAATLFEIQLLEGCEFLAVSGQLGPSELGWIGLELRDYHEDILREPVPERLLALLDQSLARRTFH